MGIQSEIRVHFLRLLYFEVSRACNDNRYWNNWVDLLFKAVIKVSNLRICTKEYLSTIHNFKLTAPWQVEPNVCSIPCCVPVKT